MIKVKYKSMNCTSGKADLILPTMISTDLNRYECGIKLRQQSYQNLTNENGNHSHWL